MGGLVIDPEKKGRADADRLFAQMQKLQDESVRSSARLAGLAARTVTQTRARPSTGGGLSGGGPATGGQAQRLGGIQGGKIGGPLGHRGPTGSSASTPAGA